MSVQTIRPSAKAIVRIVPILPLALVFAGAQLYLARLMATAATAYALIILLSALAVCLWWFAFLRNARVCVDANNVIVFDWLGRGAFKAGRTQVRLEAFSVKYWGTYRDVAILARIDGNASVALWRDSWGTEPFGRLTLQFHDATSHSAHRLMSAQTFRTQYPHIRLENLPAIALVILVVLAVAVVLSRH